MMKNRFSYLYILVICFLFFSCREDESQDISSVDTELKISRFCFLSSNNELNIIKDVDCDIVGDSLIECYIPYVMPSKHLKPCITSTGGEVFLDGLTYIPDNYVDFSKPVVLLIKKGEKEKDYKVLVHSFTGLPIIWIETAERREIVSKEDYLEASIRVEENVTTRAAGDVWVNKVKVRGRGNSTWREYPKKPYRLKFDDKVSLLGDPKGKVWALIANYQDKTMLRNEVAFYMGRMSTLDYTPRTHFVELFLNGSYNGTYQLCEQIKKGKDRVNINDDDYLLEIDAWATEEDVTFTTSHIEYPFNIKDSDIKEGSAEFDYISKFLIDAENVLYSDTFKDESKGWRAYFDEESFIDWYLVQEIVKNIDAHFSSCYLTKSGGGKIKMGPLWDFDRSLGNANYWSGYEPEGFYVKHKLWFPRLFEDELFEKKVSQRFKYFYNRKKEIFNFINDYADYLKYSIVENNNKWNVLYNWVNPSYNTWGDYQNEIQYLKSFIDKRLEWLREQYETE